MSSDPYTDVRAAVLAGAASVRDHARVLRSVKGERRNDAFRALRDSASAIARNEELAYELLGGAPGHWATVVDLAQGAQRLTDALLGQGAGPPIPGDTTIKDLLAEVEQRLDQLGAT
jgi:hypothetical protein